MTQTDPPHPTNTQNDATPPRLPLGSTLTPCETAIMEMLVVGMTDKEVARHRGIARRTVSNHVSTILLKLSARNRTDAVAIALDRRIVRYNRSDSMNSDGS